MNSISVSDLRLQYAAAYREGKIAPSDDTLYTRLHKKLVETIRDYRGFNEETFDPNPSLKIRQLCDEFSDVAALLAENDALFMEFFKWAIRDNNAIEPFIFFPDLVELLKASNLSQRIGFYAGEHLKVVREGAKVKSLALRIEGEEIEITDLTRQVRLGDGSTRTVDELFKAFKHKSVHPGDLEFLKEKGITWWPSYEPWKAMDLDHPEYWRTIPVLKTLTIEEVQRKFGKTVAGLELVEATLPRSSLIEKKGLFFIENALFAFNEVEVLEEQGDQCKVRMRERIPVDGTHFLVVQRSTEEQGMSFARTHAFADIYIPLGDGCYQLYNDGKYPKVYPTSQMRLMMDFARMVAGVYQLYDDNLWYNHREHAREPLGLSPTQGRVMMEVRRFLIRQAKSGDFPFEFQSQGCAKMQQVDTFRIMQLLLQEKITDPAAIQERLQHLLFSDEVEVFDRAAMPNFFRTNLTHVRPEGFLGRIYSFIRGAPLVLQPLMFSSVYLLFGAWRPLNIAVGPRRLEMSHHRSYCWRDGLSLYHPGALHALQRAKGIDLESRKNAFFQGHL